MLNGHAPLQFDDKFLGITIIFSVRKDFGTYCEKSINELGTHYVVISEVVHCTYQCSSEIEDKVDPSPEYPQISVPRYIYHIAAAR